MARRLFLIALLLGFAEASAARADLFDPGETHPDDSNARPPNFIVVPALRFAIRRALAPDWSLEVYARPVIGLSGTPFDIRTSQGAGGISLSRTIGAWQVSGTLEATVTADGFFRVYQASTVEGSFQVSRTFSAEGSPWSFGPRLTVGYRVSDDPTRMRSKVELALPVFYQIAPGFDAIAVTRADSRTYQRFDGLAGPLPRTDYVVNAALGLRAEIRPGVLVSTFVAAERRFSNIPDVRYSRLIIAPQLSLRASF